MHCERVGSVIIHELNVSAMRQLEYGIQLAGYTTTSMHAMRVPCTSAAWHVRMDLHSGTMLELNTLLISALSRSYVVLLAWLYCVQVPAPSVAVCVGVCV